MKKRHEQSTASIPVHLVAGTSILQRLKDLSKIDEKDEGFVQVYFHKRKSCSLAFSCPHKESRKFNQLQNQENLSFRLQYQGISRQGLLKPILRLVRKSEQSLSHGTKKVKLHHPQIVSPLTILLSVLFVTLYTTVSTSIPYPSREVQKICSKGTIDRCSKVSSSIY